MNYCKYLTISNVSIDIYLLNLRFKQTHILSGLSDEKFVYEKPEVLEVQNMVGLKICF